MNIIIAITTTFITKRLLQEPESTVSLGLKGMKGIAQTCLPHLPTMTEHS